MIILLTVILLLLLVLGILLSAVLLAAGWLRHRSGMHLPRIQIALGGAICLIVVGITAQALLNHNLPQQWIGELFQSYREQNLPGRVVQVDLDSFRAISQYDADIANTFGPNGCGLIAPAQAVMGSQSGLADTPQNLAALAQHMEAIRVKAVRQDGSPAYGPVTGIQPAELAQALQAIGYKVTVHDHWSLQDMYETLADGNIVIVDIRIQEQSEFPSTDGSTLAHYTRVLGIDRDNQKIYLENTLTQAGSSYWTLSLTDFLAVWQHPETLATNKPSLVDPSIHEEDVSQWALVIQR